MLSTLWSEFKLIKLRIHGGGLTSGYGSDPTWDGGNLASRGDIVVVDINYRLGKSMKLRGLPLYL
jgi:hypothetical protein